MAATNSVIDVDTLYEEVSRYVAETDVRSDGERLISTYEDVVAVIVRLQQIKNDIAYLELLGDATPAHKKFRTTILEHTIDMFKTVAAFESRKLTAKRIELELDREGRNGF